MKRKILCLFLLLSIMSSMIIIPKSVYAQGSSIVDSYKSILSTHGTDTMTLKTATGETKTFVIYSKYAIYDIDKDNIPELLVDDADDHELYVYSFCNGELSSCSEYVQGWNGTIYYEYPEGNGIIVHGLAGGRDGIDGISRYAVEDGKLEQYTLDGTVNELKEWLKGYNKIVFKDVTDLSLFDSLQNPIRVVLNGKEIEFDQPPIMAEGDRVMVPIRPVAEAMGDEVKWCEYLNSALIVHADRMVVFQNDDNEACIYVDPADASTWDTYYCDVPPQNINGRTLTPVRAIGECLGAKVDWDNDTKTVFIEYDQNTPRTLKDNAVSQLNALYFTYCMQESDFSDYSNEINYFCENRNGWSDAFIIWMDDWTISLDIMASGEKTNVYMIKKCLAETLSEVPDNGEFSSYCLELHNEVSSWIRKVGSLSQYTLRELLSVAPDDKGYFSRLSNEISSLGKTLKYLNVGVDYLVEVLSDYSTGMYYIDVLRTSLYNAGVTDETIHNSLNELENDYVYKYANSLYENVTEIGSGALLNAITGKTFKAAEAFKDLAMVAGEALTNNKDKATHVKNLNCIYLFNDYIDDAYNHIRYTLLSDTSKLDEYIVMFNLQKNIKTKAYNAMAVLSANDDYTKKQISDQVDKLSKLTYMIFE